ncbi:MAG: alpha/beta fold hydrolase [Sphingobacteriales bacterium]|jgi:predicted alpha/beta-fold hydrolase|nr:alpha/beta fold hydrolase [Sphingobacteriales bacterium]MBP9141649.1 alpha/beta fold hydrolase [Chitinophagales bacterium]MDA0198835.1 alpha/beta fold hydrolase [Bacteroidota bacterium]MBK6891112.1 alpha/beta fold hydrolase [Sphingobacteriales bacterium]MBK7527062.1 alpha/beta fold hydrolase [Sphingobacteriales bacterium]
MPLISSSLYKSPWWLSQNGHIQTIYPYYLRRVKELPYLRERINTLDGDFIDVDWYKQPVTNSKLNDTLLIVLHGMEGHSLRPYILGLVTKATQSGFDALAVNFRGCSGQPNRYLHAYHSGQTDDLHFLVDRIAQTNTYRRIFLAGFSLGGNVVLKYLGEHGTNIANLVKAAVAFCVPTNLAESANIMGKGFNRNYEKSFLNSLKQKLAEKADRFPEDIDLLTVNSMQRLFDFDEYYTSRVHGFENAADYYAKANSHQFLPFICVPTLLINPLNDPFLPPACYPTEIARQSNYFYLELPKHGGHIGFYTANAKNGIYWHDERALSFLIEKGA